MKAAAQAGWLDLAEVGSLLGIRFVLALCALFGRGTARAFLRVLVFYYVCVHRSGRASSRAYLRRVGEPSDLTAIYRHFLAFAFVALDRLLLAARRFDRFEIASHGREHLEQLRAEGKGALLLGAHLGSFEAMRAGGVTQDLPINIVVNAQNARRLQHVLERLDPSMRDRIIPLGEGSLEFVLRIRECIERGEMVAILADRFSPGTRTTRVSFLGSDAAFAAGPFVIAATLGCPVLLTFGLYRGENRYDLFCEPFADAIRLPRKEREAALRAVVQRFATKLEEYVRRAPRNWFNFYDFWSQT